MIYSISEHAWTAGTSWFNIRQNSRSSAIKATIRPSGTTVRQRTVIGVEAL